MIKLLNNQNPSLSLIATQQGPQGHQAALIIGLVVLDHAEAQMHPPPTQASPHTLPSP